MRNKVLPFSNEIDLIFHVKLQLVVKLSCITELLCLSYKSCFILDMTSFCFSPCVKKFHMKKLLLYFIYEIPFRHFEEVFGMHQ